MSAKAVSEMLQRAFFSQHVILKRQRKCCQYHISYFKTSVNMRYDVEMQKCFALHTSGKQKPELDRGNKVK